MPNSNNEILDDVLNSKTVLDASLSERTLANTLGEDLGNQINATRQAIPFSVTLIEQIRPYPCLWNVSLNCHKDKPEKKWKLGAE